MIAILWEAVTLSVLAPFGYAGGVWVLDKCGLLHDDEEVQP